MPQTGSLQQTQRDCSEGHGKGTGIHGYQMQLRRAENETKQHYVASVQLSGPELQDVCQTRTTGSQFFLPLQRKHPGEIETRQPFSEVVNGKVIITCFQTL